MSRMVVPYSSFAFHASAKYDSGYGGCRAASMTRDVVALASLVREECHPSEAGDEDNSSPPGAYSEDNDPRKKRRGRRKRRDIIVDWWLFKWCLRASPPTITDFFYILSWYLFYISRSWYMPYKLKQLSSVIQQREQRAILKISLQLVCCWMNYDNLFRNCIH
jgi:hypothetical protein